MKTENPTYLGDGLHRARVHRVFNFRPSRKVKDRLPSGRLKNLGVILTTDKSKDNSLQSFRKRKAEDAVLLPSSEDSVKGLHGSQSLLRPVP